MSTRGGIQGRISNLLTGGPGRLYPKGAGSVPAELFAQRAGARALMAGTAFGMSPYGDESLSEAERREAEGGPERRPPGDPGAGGGAGAGGMYQDLFEQIKEYEEAASIPSASELTRYKLDEDRAKSLGDRRAGIEALRPTAEQYGQRQRGVGFGALSRLFGRTGDPSKRQDFGQIGEDIRSETDRQLRERLGFEEKLAGIDTSIYGVEGESLGRRVARERAGDPFKGVHLGAMQAEAAALAAHRRAIAVANVGVERENQKQISRLYQMLMEQTLSGPEEQMIIAEIQRLGGSSGEVDEFLGLMEQAQGAR
jgi:hypothetical protein